MRRPLLATALLLGLAACAGSRRPQEVALQPPLSLPTVDSLRQIVESRRQSLHSLRSEARVNLESPEGSGSARQAILAARPDFLRVEVFSPFGTAFVLTAAHGRLAAYVRNENRLYRGVASRENLSHYAQLDLRLPDIVDLMLGTPPERQPGFGLVFFDPASGHIRLRQEIPTGTQVIDFAGEPLRPVAVEQRARDDQLIWRAEFSRHESIGGVLVPLHIDLEQPEHQRRVSIDFESPEPNPELAGRLFALQPPPGSEEVDLDSYVD